MKIRSSYKQNNFGEVLRSYVETYLPVNCVELGVLDGYSTKHIALGLKGDTEKYRGEGHLDAYDLWDDYPYKHGDMEKVRKYLEESGVFGLVTLYKQDAFEVHNWYDDNSITFLHIDISNDGEKIEKLMVNWNVKLQVGAVVAIEGGSEERDKVDWMVRHNKKPIKPVIETNEIINRSYIYETYLKFPSLTVLLKRRD